LQATNAKFARRFRHVEKRATEAGAEMAKLPLEQLDAWWDEAKRLERAGPQAG
jgi:tetrapyrrole methylase family protein / MazG family protein